MVRHARLVCLLIFLVFAAAGSPACAEGVLDFVPRDTQAFLYLRNWKSFDNKFTAILAPLLGRNPIVVTPGIVIQVIVGKEVGLDPEGELLVAVVSSQRGLERSQQFIWLPFADYGKFASALGGKPDEPITVITISGEDLLCARQGRWALIVDPQQRERMTAMLAGKSDSPPSLAGMRDWLVRQDIATAVLPTEETRKEFRDWLAAGAGNLTLEKFYASDILASGRPAPPSVFDFFGVSPTRRRVVHEYLSSSPKLGNLMYSADAVALGVRLDDSINGTAGLRMAWPKEAPERQAIGNVAAIAAAPALHRDGDFIVSGGGAVPGPLAAAAMEAYAAHLIEELRRDSSRSQLDKDLIARFARASTEAAGEVHSAAVFWPMGPEKEGVSTNRYLALRVASAEKFIERAAEIMRRWNELNGQAQPSTGIVFDAKQVQVAGRAATQYSLDIVASVGAEDTSEMKQVMERMFGPDRKLHLVVATVDPQTVLLVLGTPQQAAQAVAALADAKRTADWNTANVAATNGLLPPGADWRLFFSPRGYEQQQERELEAAGAPFGRPPATIVAESPPLGAAGGFRDGTLSIDVVAPIETIKAVLRAQSPRPQ